MSERPPLSIVIVAYNALDKLRVCLDSIAAQQGLDGVETLVVDNASSEPVASTVAAEYPWVRLLASDTNLGFAGGTNRGCDAARGERLLWLNPDTELPEPDTLARLVARLDRAAGLGALGCRLVYPDGSTQPVSGLAPRVADAVADLLHLGRPAPPPDWAAAADCERIYVEYACGAALLMAAHIWRAVGPMDEEYFMYLEDVDWCRRARDAGYEIALAPDVVIVHHEGASYGGRALVRRRHYWRALVRYVSKHRPRREALSLRVALLVSALAKLPPAALLDHSAERAERLALLRSQAALGWRGA